MRTVVGVFFMVLAFSMLFCLVAFKKGIEAAVFVFAFAFVVLALILIGVYFITQ